MAINIADLTAEQQLGYGDDELSSLLDMTIHTNDLDDGATVIDNKPMTDANFIESSNADIIDSQPLIDEGGDKVNSITGKEGTKATRNNNPGNITGMSGKLLYGAIGFAKSNTGDKGDQNQLIFKTPKDGFMAMHKLALTRYSDAPIRTAFRAWQTDMKSFNQKLNSLNKAGIDINIPYKDLDSNEQKEFRKIWARYEGYTGEVY